MDDEKGVEPSLIDRLKENIVAFAEEIRNEQNVYYRFEEFARNAITTLTPSDVRAAALFAERKLLELKKHSGILRTQVQAPLVEIITRRQSQLKDTSEGDQIKEQIRNGARTINKLEGNYTSWITTLKKRMPANDNEAP